MENDSPIKHKDCSADMSKLVDVSDPVSVFSEVKAICEATCPEFDTPALKLVFDDVVALFGGRYPGFKACNTEYHDLKHTTDVFLTMARLIHGLKIEGHAISPDGMKLGLISALLHDTGYIQTENDEIGTGAKFTTVHVERSIEFMRNYFSSRGFPQPDAGACGRMIAATNIVVSLSNIPFATHEEELMGKALFSADLLGQMADRVYLENLLFLFKEFIEGLVSGFRSEDELLEKTLGFYEIIRQRLETEIGYREKYMRSHFLKQWNIDCDLYLAGVEKNISYLKNILENYKDNYADMLRRGGIVKKYTEQKKRSLSR